MTYRQAWEAVVAVVRARRGEDFTTSDLSKYLAISRQAAHGWLHRFVVDGRLVSVGQGRGTRYRLASFTPGHPDWVPPRPLLGQVGEVVNTVPSTTARYWPTGSVPTMSNPANFPSEWRELEGTKPKK